jgi:alpha-tubulin suppressor-like RCC1 family protein
VLGLVPVLATACGGAVQRGGASNPSAVVVVPAPVTAGPGVVSNGEPATAVDDVAPLEIAIDTQMLCVRAAGRVHCSNTPASDVALTAPPPLEGIDDAISLALGSTFGCVATRAGKVFCFGDNTYGQLGAQLRDGRRDKPVLVNGVSGAKRVFTSDSQACALLVDGSVRCWGRNDGGQTGGSTYYVPAAHELVEADLVEGVKGATSVAPGGWTTCAATRARGVTCWGRALLGDDHMMHATRNTSPSEVPELGAIESVTASGGAFCGIAGGEVKCWGELHSLFPGEAGRSSKLTNAGVTHARKVRIAQTHGCAVLTDGTLSCWGMGSYGALGRGDITGYEALGPEPVREVTSAVDIAVGSASSCAITGAREVYCWGSWPHAGGAMRKESLPVKMRLE